MGALAVVLEDRRDTAIAEAHPQAQVVLVAGAVAQLGSHVLLDERDVAAAPARGAVSERWRLYRALGDLLGLIACGARPGPQVERLLAAQRAGGGVGLVALDLVPLDRVAAEVLLESVPAAADRDRCFAQSDCTVIGARRKPNATTGSLSDRSETVATLGSRASNERVGHDPRLLPKLSAALHARRRGPPRCLSRMWRAPSLD